MRKKVLITVLILIFLYCMGGVVYSLFVTSNNTNEIEKKILDINNYDYKVDENLISDLYASEFKKLKINLETNDIDYNEYIESISKLYIIDLYSLKDKLNKYNVTSAQYVYSDSQENYKFKVNETLYKYIEDNSDNNRKQELPRVVEVIVKSVENTTYLIGNTEYESYNVNVEWLYEKDLGYDTNAVLTLIRKNNVVSVVEEKRIDLIEETNVDLNS